METLGRFKYLLYLCRRNTQETSMLIWNSNGQLSTLMNPHTGDIRHHWWNDAGQMSSFVDNERCGYYGYDGNGNRAYKLTGYSSMYQYNAGAQETDIFIDDAVIYVNPYMVVTPDGYTKHYYNGSQRVAAKMGNSPDLAWLIDNNNQYTAMRSNAEALLGESFCVDYGDFENYDYTISNMDKDGGYSSVLQPLETNETEEFYVNINAMPDLILSSILNNEPRYSDGDIYYYHGDHLGSATWITDATGAPVQYIQYLPTGEIWQNQMTGNYNERFKFTGKEHDEESGYDYFGARYYWSLGGIWTAIDPLADKYPNNNPYMYCSGNPLKYVDPDGRDWYEAEDGSAVLWRKGNDATITIADESYRNIGESYSHTIGNTTYNYNQNSLSSISVNTMTSGNFISQFAKDDWDGTSANFACQKACDAMLTSAGFTSNAYSSSNAIVDNNNGSAGHANVNAPRVIRDLTTSLYTGYPAKASVDCKPNSSSHADKIGDHFIVIMGITEFVSNGMVTGTNYRFFDPGTRHSQYGANKKAVLQLSNGRLVGTAPYGQHRPYVVTSIRFCK